METKVGDKVVVYDAELGDVTGEVIRFDRDGDPVCRFEDGTIAEIEKEYIMYIVCYRCRGNGWENGTPLIGANGEEYGNRCRKCGGTGQLQ